MTNPDSQNNFLHDLLPLLSQEGSGAFQQILQVLLNKAMLTREKIDLPQAEIRLRTRVVND